uniref:RING-type domain-containing protein n=2 Tax=Dunaliella tertiolecta TaxID=3047 RepID=A0A7S3QWJ6_DUNTE|mmetsp:Transcript_27549/g.74533  ORF Transcript_27549/g.74533 Transcript_27549/m.74533 type:complete len:203 (+) Transcript_27549:173-781(+)
MDVAVSQARGREDAGMPNLRQREKQIQYGKNTPEYQLYLQQIPKCQRRRGDIRSPDPYANISKRAFDGCVKCWRRDLHLWQDRWCANQMLSNGGAVAVHSKSNGGVQCPENVAQASLGEKGLDQGCISNAASSGGADAANEDDLLCTVCWHDYQATILFPCGHAVLCAGCADSVMKEERPGRPSKICPMCRSHISEVLHVAE